MNEQTDRMTDLPDPEAPPEDAFEQALPVADDAGDDRPVDVLPDDIEVPEPDAIEQHQPAPSYEEDWR